MPILTPGVPACASRPRSSTAHHLHNQRLLAHLVLELHAFIRPVWENFKPLHNAHWLRYGDKGYDYMMTSSENAVVIVRADVSRKATSNDSSIDFVPRAHLLTVIPRSLNLDANKSKATHMWSGFLGLT